MENYYSPVAVLQGCCVDCLTLNYILNKMRSLQIYKKKEVPEKGEKLLMMLI